MLEDVATVVERPAVRAMAVFIGSTRLIDNVVAPGRARGGLTWLQDPERHSRALACSAVGIVDEWEFPP